MAAFARYSAVVCLRDAPKGLTSSDLRSRVPSLDEAALESLKVNEKITYNATKDLFIYKDAKKLPFTSREELLALLQQEPVLLDADSQSAYENVMEDVEELYDERKILYIRHALSKTSTNATIMTHPLRDHLPEPYELSDALRELWNQIPRVTTYGDLVKTLSDSKIPTNKLDCSNNTDMFMSRKPEKAKRKKRKAGKVSLHTEIGLAKLAKTIVFSAFEDSDTPVTVTEDEDEEEDEEAFQNSLVVHKDDANPEEWATITHAAHLLATWFYGDLEIAIITLFLRQKMYYETAMQKLLQVPTKQLTTALTTLSNHQLLARTMIKLKKEPNAAPNKPNATVNLWAIDLNKFFDSVNYRLAVMRKRLSSEIALLEQEVLRCPTCKIGYKSIDLTLLIDKTRPGVYLCRVCSQPLEQTAHSDAVKQKQQLLRDLDTTITPLREMLLKLLRSTHSESAASIAIGGSTAVQTQRKLPGKVQPGPAKRLFATSAVKDEKKSIFTSLPKLAATNATTTTTSTKAAVKKEPDEPVQEMFDTTPLHFGANYEVFLPTIEDFATQQREKGFQLAKQMLDMAAEFDCIRDGHYIYRFSKHSLFVALKKGVTPPTITRTLNGLSKNEMPTNMFLLIMEVDKYKNYYRAVVVLKGGKYHVQSESLELLTEMLGNLQIRELVSKPDEVNKTVRTIGQFTSETYSFEIGDSIRSLEQLKMRTSKIGVPLIDELDVTDPTSAGGELNVHLKDGVAVRDYQHTSVSKLFWDSFKCHSGILVLPCGAGKTLVGISLLALLKRPSVIFCQSIMGVKQWRDQLLRWTNITPRQVVRFTAAFDHEWDPHPNYNAHFIITTYAMFSAKDMNRRRQAARDMISGAQGREWGSIIFDEVHQAPADVFRVVTSNFKAHIKIGLTATLVREDERVVELPFLVGPKLYELDIFTLRMRKHIAHVFCHEIHCPMTDSLFRVYQAADREEQKLLFITNLNKTRVCQTLIKQHLENKRKIMIFCDDIFGLTWYHHMLKRPMVHGKTPQEQREKILADFRTKEGGDCVLFSKVGDQSIDLPEADVVIQIAVIQGSRMQELQRIGRVQRPQANKQAAYFYSLVSEVAGELTHAQKRREYLIDKGYAVEVHSNFSAYIEKDSEAFYAAEPDLLKLVREELSSRADKRDKKDRDIASEADSIDHDNVGNAKKSKKRKEATSATDFRSELKKKNKHL